MTETVGKNDQIRKLNREVEILNAKNNEFINIPHVSENEQTNTKKGLEWI